jgi:hypothetical protein
MRQKQCSQKGNTTKQSDHRRVLARHRRRLPSRAPPARAAWPQLLLLG